MPSGPHTLDEAVTALRQGGAVVFPTDTVYGLGVSVRDAKGPALLYEAKGRPSDKPVAWLVAGVDDLSRYGTGDLEQARRLAGAFWPGPLTIIVPAGDDVPAAFRSADGTIGLRCPDDALARELIARLGCPIATTSANLSGKESPMTFGEVDEALLAAVSGALADDEAKSGIASTIVSCVGDELVLLREGALSLADLASVS